MATIDQSSSSSSSLNLWHCRLGHPSIDTVKSILASCNIPNNTNNKDPSGRVYIARSVKFNELSFPFKDKLHASSPTSLHHCSHNDTSSQLPTLSRDTTSKNSTSLPLIPTLPMSRVLRTTCTTNPSHGTSPSAACFPTSSHAKSSTNESDTSSPCLPTRDPPLPSHDLHQGLVQLVYVFALAIWLVMAGSETPKVKDIIIYGVDACGSTPLRSMGRGRLSSSRKKQSRKKRIDDLRIRVSSQISKGSLDKKSIMTGVPDCSSIANLAIHGGISDCNPFLNPAFHGSIEETWLDSVAVFDCECDDDYQRVTDVVVSLNGSEGGLIPNFPIKDANHETSFLLSKNILIKCLSQMNFSRPDKSFISSCSQILTTSLEKVLNSQ
ncbi:uncharacterized protein G2W53_010198 [Senna tora]|uniref:GAG-pre-integrase domain-containing protein n=1 Tax=Senna tora TaxID=362788 RepID=A0A834WZT0_9FABA|nr:uncharacterized protein G2W53_010198 [Senna tora]